MAIKKIQVPFCDVCGEPWLPKHRLDDGTINPVFEKPDRSKRCGKCKSTRWNAAGVDRRRKAVAFDGPVAKDPDPSMQQRLDRSVTIIEQFLEEDPEQILVPEFELPADEIRKMYPMPTVPEEVFQYAESAMKVAQILCGASAEIKRRCKHGLYACPECHHQEAA